MLQPLKPGCLEPVHNKRSPCIENLLPTKNSSACLLHLEKAHVQQQRLMQPKIENNNNDDENFFLILFSSYIVFQNFIVYLCFLGVH